MSATIEQWEELAEGAVASLTEATRLAAYWKACHDDEAARRLIAEAFAEEIRHTALQVILTVLAAGFHPLHEAGIELTEVFRDSIVAGDLEPEDIDIETVWMVAAVRGLEPDLTPLL